MSPRPPRAGHRGGRGLSPDRGQLAELGRRIDAGRLRPVVGGVWPLAEGRQAFQAKQHGGLPDKAVLRVAEEPAPPA